MVARPSGVGCGRAIKAKLCQIKFINKQINNAHRIVGIDIVIQARRHQCDLVPAFAFNESLHRQPPHLCLMHRPQREIRVHPFSHNLDPNLSVEFPESCPTFS